MSQAPSAALAATLADELIRCGLREVVLAPGSRSAPLAIAFHRRAEAGDVRLSVRIDERSAAFCALGLAKRNQSPAAVLCTSGTAAAHFHAAVIEADESAVPLLVLTADRPPELRGTGANQTIDQLRLYGPAVRWFCEMGVAEDRAGQDGYWRSTACRAWGLASGTAGGAPGPVHVNLAFREPLVPEAEPGTAASDDHGAGLAPASGTSSGRAGGAPWTRFAAELELPWAERGVLIFGDGDYDPAPLLNLATQAGWPVLAEPSSNARHGPSALGSYQYLIGDAGFMASHQPEMLVSAGRPGLSRSQLALLRSDAAARHVVVAQGPGRWADPARSATDVAASIRLTGDAAAGQVGGWLRDWLTADRAAGLAVDAVLDSDAGLSEPRLARDVAAALPENGLLWAASSLPIRDLDQHMRPRSGPRILASRGASGIDGLVSSAIGAALAHQATGGGQAIALLGDLALLHDAPGLLLGAREPRPDLCVIVANNDGGGIFSMLEQAALPGPFERVFGTPHGSGLAELAAAARLPYQRVERADELAGVLAVASAPGSGIRLVEVRSDRAGQAALRHRLTDAAAAALSRLG
ncbi:MAG: 2-succinyl-5-enolpyruvyl-6-hydroxy-3-cyclohexene-1-carboxylic-acid synthase [Streptosporangiaceae bacterium]